MNKFLKIYFAECLYISVTECFRSEAYIGFWSLKYSSE